MRRTTEDELRDLREAVDELIDAIAKAWHLYVVLDWLSERLKKK